MEAVDNTYISENVEEIEDDSEIDVQISGSVNDAKGAGASRYKVSLPAVLNPHPAIIQPFGEIDQRLRQLYDFVSHLEHRLSVLFAASQISQEVALEALSIIRQLLLREGASANFNDGSENLFRRLWAERSYQELLQETHQAISAALLSHTAALDKIQILRNLESVLSWYTRRKLSLYLLSDGEYYDDGGECLFGMRVLHDQTWCGVTGVQVVCGMRLIGRASSKLWLKAQMRINGVLVGAALGWEAWTDDLDDSRAIETFSKLAEGDSNGAEFGMQRPERQMMEPTNGDITASPHNSDALMNRPFAAIIPITPLAQRSIIDAVRIFIPYDALDLAPGRHEVELELILEDETGTTVSWASQLEVWRRPGAEIGLKRNVSLGVPPPQVLGFTAVDAVHGHAVRSIRPRIAASRNLGRTSYLLEVSADLEFRGAGGQSFILALRIIDSLGRDVLETSDRSDAADNMQSLRRTLAIGGALHSFDGIRLCCPLDRIKVQDSMELFAEVTVRSEEGRVLVGDLCSLSGLGLGRISGASKEAILAPAIMQRGLLRSLDSRLSTNHWQGGTRPVYLVELDLERSHNLQAETRNGALLQLGLESHNPDGSIATLSSRQLLLDQLRSVRAAAERHADIISCYLDLGAVSEAQLKSKILLRTRLLSLDGGELFSNSREAGLWQLPQFRQDLSKQLLRAKEPNPIQGGQPVNTADAKLRMLALRVSPADENKIALDFCIEAETEEAAVKGRLGLIYASLNFTRQQSIRKTVSVACELHGGGFDLSELSAEFNPDAVSMNVRCYLNLPAELPLDAEGRFSCGAGKLSAALLSRNGRLIQSTSVSFDEALKKTLSGRQAFGFEMDDLACAAEAGRFKLSKFLFG